MAGLFERLQEYIASLGGVEAISELPDYKTAFEPFILEGKKNGNHYQALLGCTLQAYVNYHGDNGFIRLSKGDEYKKTGLDKHPNFMKAITGADLIDGKDDGFPQVDGRSYQLLLRGLLSASNNPEQCNAEEGRKLSNTIALILCHWAPPSFRVKHWGDLIRKYDASPFKDLDVAVIGNAESMEGEYLKVTDPEKYAKLSDQRTLPSFLFKQVTEFNEARGYLTRENVDQHEHRFDAVLDCNVIYEHADTLELVRLMERLAKKGGMIVHDKTYGGTFTMMPTLSKILDEYRKKIGQEVLEETRDCTVVRQVNIPDRTAEIINDAIPGLIPGVRL